MKFQTKRQKKHFAVVLILLSAIFSGVFSFAFYSPNQSQTAEMVYCPLTNRLQPVHASDLNQTKNEFDEICLTDKQKNDFSAAILKKINFGFSISKQKTLEEIVFDFLKNGKSALDSLPSIPNLPEKRIAKNSLSTLSSTNSKEAQFVWKLQNEKHLFLQNPRPPTLVSAVNFESKNLFKSEKNSRRIAPRAPPFSL